MEAAFSKVLDEIDKGKANVHAVQEALRRESAAVALG